ncbi:hypothetical protein MRB53_037715 [Persea americana]|nr:hypothetical protein MRB53_037715 [Persea americana]
MKRRYELEPMFSSVGEIVVQQVETPMLDIDGREVKKLLCALIDVFTAIDVRCAQRCYHSTLSRHLYASFVVLLMLLSSQMTVERQVLLLRLHVFAFGQRVKSCLASCSR